MRRFDICRFLAPLPVPSFKRCWATATHGAQACLRVRVEHVFGAQANDMGGTLVRTIGLVRAKAKIGMKNLAYTMRRLVQPRRLTPCPA